MDEFYLFLYCGDSISTYVNNHSGDFVVNLPKRFLLEGSWECALTEITMPSHLERQSHRIYVCTDIVEESYARDSLLPLLRATEPLEEGTLEFVKPYYVKLRQSELHRVRVFIRDDRLEPCRFKLDRLYCTIHLRRRKWGL